MSFFTKMNDKLSEGWKMTNINCKCKFNLLLQPETKLLYCPKCEYQTTEPAEIRIEEDEDDDVIVQPIESISKQDDEFMKLDQEVKDMFNKPSKSDEYSKMLGQKLIQGWAMLEDSCPDCLIPIMKSRQGKRVCVGCEHKQQDNSLQLQQAEKVLKNDVQPINNLNKKCKNKNENETIKDDIKFKDFEGKAKKDDKEIKNIEGKETKKDDKEIKNKQEKEIKKNIQKKSSSSSSSSSSSDEELEIKMDKKQKTHKSYSDVFKNLQENSLKYSNSIGMVLEYYQTKLQEAINHDDTKLVKKFIKKLTKISDANLKFYDKIKKLSK